MMMMMTEDELNGQINSEIEKQNKGQENIVEENQMLTFKAFPLKRHIGAVYRSGFLPSHRALRSFGYGLDNEMTGTRFSRSGRGRPIV